MSSPTATANPGARCALVTGASAGIGAEFARQLAARGMHLVLVARRVERLNALARELRAQHAVEVLVIDQDLAAADACNHILAELRQNRLHIDYLVNNAGFGLPGSYTSNDWSEHGAYIQLMVSVVAELTHHLLPAMQARGWGRIINVASVVGLVPGTAGHTLYAASKAFLVRFSESLAMENEQRGVRVIALCPGLTYSEFHDVTGTREIASKMPRRMWLEAADVVRHALAAIEQPDPLAIAVPGAYYRRILLLSRFLPQRLMRGILRRRHKNFRKTD
jgi:hypothetical protein